MIPITDDIVERYLVRRVRATSAVPRRWHAWSRWPMKTDGLPAIVADADRVLRALTDDPFVPRHATWR